MKTLAKLWNWVLSLFASKIVECAAEEVINLQADVEQTTPPITQIDAPVKRARKRSEVPETLADLLDNMESIFDSLRLPDDKIEWIPKEERRALRRLGVYIPPYGMVCSDDNGDELRVAPQTKFPTMMCISCADPKKPHHEGFMYTQLWVGMRLKKLPANVVRHSGIPYLFGGAETSPDKLLRGELWWGCFYATINPRTGAIHICDEFRAEITDIPLRSPSNRKILGRSRRVFRYRWQTPMFLSYKWDRENNQPVPYSDVRTAQKIVIWNMINWWNGRESQWSVAVSRGNNRVTFGVNPEHTKKYFVDRDKTVKAADGRAKRIIHHVSAHNRTLSDGRVASVKEHVRGLREFTWHDSHCVVTAPRFTGFLATSLFDRPPEEIEYGAAMPTGMITADQLAKQLVRAEDTDYRKQMAAA